MTARPRLTDSLRAWGTDAFAETLRREFEGLDPDLLPLRRGSARGGRIDRAGIGATVLGVVARPGRLDAKLGVFFCEVNAGCSCGDGPVLEPAYCELLVGIDRTTGEAAFELA